LPPPPPKVRNGAKADEKGQVRSLLDKRVGAVVTVGLAAGGIALSEVLVDLVADYLQLTLLELGNADAAPALGGANERGVDEL